MELGTYLKGFPMFSKFALLPTTILHTPKAFCSSGPLVYRWRKEVKKMRRKPLIYFLGSAFATVVYLAVCSVPIADAVSGEFDVDEIVTAIKQEIQTARATETGLPRLKIDRVDIELAVVMEREITGGLKIKVAGFGAGITAGRSKGEAHTLKLVLSPTWSAEIAKASDLGLVKAIQSVKTALRNAYNKPPPFKLETFTFEIEFAVEKKAGVGFSFLIIDLPGAKTKNLATHKVKIYMSLAD